MAGGGCSANSQHLSSVPAWLCRRSVRGSAACAAVPTFPASCQMPHGNSPAWLFAHAQTHEHSVSTFCDIYTYHTRHIGADVIFITRHILMLGPQGSS